MGLKLLFALAGVICVFTSGVYVGKGDFKSIAAPVAGSTGIGLIYTALLLRRNRS